MAIPGMFNKVKQVPTFPSDPYGGEFVSAHDWANNNTVVIYTVPANKVLYITDWNMSMNHGSVVSMLYGGVYNPTPAFLYYFAHSINTSGNVFLCCPLTVPYVLPAGYSVRAVSPHGASTTDLTFHGWLFDTI